MTVSELEDWSEKSTQNQAQRDKGMRNTKQRVKDRQGASLVAQW